VHKCVRVSWDEKEVQKGDCAGAAVVWEIVWIGRRKLREGGARELVGRNAGDREAFLNEKNYSCDGKR